MEMIVVSENGIHVIQCNYLMPTNVASFGARAVVVSINTGNDSENVEVVVRSRGGRWVRKWERIHKLTKFRRKWYPSTSQIAQISTADSRRPRADCESVARELTFSRMRNTMRRMGEPIANTWSDAG